MNVNDNKQFALFLYLLDEQKKCVLCTCRWSLLSDCSFVLNQWRLTLKAAAAHAVIDFSLAEMEHASDSWWFIRPCCYFHGESIKCLCGSFKHSEMTFLFQLNTEEDCPRPLRRVFPSEIKFNLPVELWGSWGLPHNWWTVSQGKGRRISEVAP